MMRSAGNWQVRGIGVNSLPLIIMGVFCSFLWLKESGLGIIIMQFTIVENLFQEKYYG
jgi:hypothetical protein